MWNPEEPTLPPPRLRDHAPVTHTRHLTARSQSASHLCCPPGIGRSAKLSQSGRRPGLAAPPPPPRLPEALPGRASRGPPVGVPRGHDGGGRAAHQGRARARGESAWQRWREEPTGEVRAVRETRPAPSSGKPSGRRGARGWEGTARGGRRPGGGGTGQWAVVSPGEGSSSGGSGGGSGLSGGGARPEGELQGAVAADLRAPRGPAARAGRRRRGSRWRLRTGRRGAGRAPAQLTSSPRSGSGRARRAGGRAAAAGEGAAGTEPGLRARAGLGRRAWQGRGPGRGARKGFGTCIPGAGGGGTGQRWESFVKV